MMIGLMKPNSRREERSLLICSELCVQALLMYGTSLSIGTSRISVVVFMFYPFLARSSRSITSSCGFAPVYSDVQFSRTIWKISAHSRFACVM